MELERLKTLIDEYGLSTHQTEILEHVRPAIALSLGQKGPGKCGQSRIGGIPDLPLSVSWPYGDRWQKYLCFLLQINFAELPQFPENPLPPQGMLYLFASEGEDNPEQIVIYSGNEAPQSACSPAKDRLITDWYDDLAAHTLQFHRVADIPHWATDDHELLCDRLSLDSEALEDLARAITENSIGQLLGHAAGIGHDPRQDAYVVREVNPKWLYNYEQRRTLDMQRAQNWQNLLRVDSCNPVNLIFGDCGYLQVLIHDSDLKQGDFSRVYVDLESS
ncbi:MAG: YwqG family protein [Cyanobacteria bacterium J06636_16]